MSKWAPVSLLCLCIVVPRIASSQTANPPTAGGWQRVDALKPGTRIVVSLKTGEQDDYYFRRATADDLTIATGPEGNPRAAERTLPKSLIAKVETYDPVKDGALRGAWVGAGGLLAWLQLSVKACGTGCENDMPPATGVGVAAIGAGIGSLVGALADRTAGPEVLFPAASSPSRPPRSNGFFPSRTHLKVGTAYTRTAFVSSAVRGTATAPTFALGVQVSPYISTHVEYTATNGRFGPAPGSIPDAVLQNVVPSCRCGAGWSHGIESRRVKYAFSPLVGVHPAPWGRFRVELVGGLGVQAQENRDYYDANRQTGQGTANDPGRTERIPGKYYVLSFESPRAGAVAGVNAEIAVTRHISVAPMVRYNWMGDPGPSVVYGIGAHWRF